MDRRTRLGLFLFAILLIAAPIALTQIQPGGSSAGGADELYFQGKWEVVSIELAGKDVTPKSKGKMSFFFHGGRVSEEALSRMKRALQSAARECAEIIERDRSTTQERNGAAFVLALRPWKYSEFAQFDRDAQNVDVLGSGLEMPWTPTGGQCVNERGESAIGHCCNSIPAFAAMRRARCWRTLALLTLTFMASAASLMVHASRKRSSRTRL